VTGSVGAALAPLLVAELIVAIHARSRGAHAAPRIRAELCYDHGVCSSRWRRPASHYCYRACQQCAYRIRQEKIMWRGSSGGDDDKAGVSALLECRDPPATTEVISEATIR